MLQSATKLRISDLAPRIMQSEIRAMSVACEAVSGINLAQGVCDTDPPAVVMDAMKSAVDAGMNTYTRLDGIERLRSAVAADFGRRHSISIDAQKEVLVTSGATGAFHATCMALLNPGDEVVVFEPFYGYHVGTLKSLRLVASIVALEGEDFRLNADALDRAITPKTRAILINTPSNPAGKVFSLDELQSIAEIAKKNDLFVFTDEIYEHFVYDGLKHFSPFTLPGMRERTVVMSGFSKTFSITGWRVGYLIASPQWTPSIGYFHDLTYVCAPAPAQHAVAAGLETLPPSFYESLSVEHCAKRETLLQGLRDVGLMPHTPRGAYYIMAEAQSLQGRTAAEKARDLLKRTGVAAVAGSAFYRHGGGEDLLRFCYAKKDADIVEACQRLRRL